jgi:hypothetical protein
MFASGQATVGWKGAIVVAMRQLVKPDSNQEHVDIAAPYLFTMAAVAVVAEAAQTAAKSQNMMAETGGAWWRET